MTDFNLTIHPQDFFMPLGFVESVEITGSGEAITQVDRVPYGETMTDLEGGTDYAYTLDDIVILYMPNPDTDSISREFQTAEIPTKLLALIEAAAECALEENKE